MKITTIDRRTHRLISERIEETLKELGDELGVRFTQSGGQYGGADGVFKISAAVVGTDGRVYDRSADEFKLLARSYGLDPKDLGHEFWFNSERYRITGLNPNAPKYPINAMRVRDKKPFRFPLSTVKRLIGAAAA